MAGAASPERAIEELFALVSEGVGAATAALLEDTGNRLDVIARRDASVERLLADVAASVEARIGGTSGDELRFLLAVLRAAPELERSHRLVLHIARRGAQGLGGFSSPRARGLVGRMGSVAADLWRTAAVAWAERDPSAAARLAERDDELDGLHAALSAELGSGSMPLPVVMDMTLVARFYERLGDHAVNVTKLVSGLPGKVGISPPAG